ncbi:winged helix-turn-helix domain-containing protein, partial [uncultured Duncaniella sp.]|uniref:winged helix-turn-helix domain-containing protein n=1 Tax=uncultured Duncaniella sp. TaxID=2768039 RepID=UPI0025B6D831
LTPPTFSVEQGGVTVHIPREKFVAINLGGTTDIDQLKGSEKSDTDRPKAEPNSDQKGDQKSNQKSDQKIIEILKGNPNTTIHQLMDLMQLSESGIKKILRKLKQTGEIRRVGSDKGGHWEVINRQ